MLIDRIAGARLAGFDQLQDVRIADGTVVEVVSVGNSPLPGERLLNADGRVVAPAFVDAHLHLDKAYLLRDAEAVGEVEPTLDAAIAAVAALRRGVSLEQVSASAERAVDALVSHGAVAARVHVEIDPDSGIELVELHLELAATLADRCQLQLVAFPQMGLERPGAADLLAAAMAAGLSVVGGCPYADDDAEAHLDAVFALADVYGAPVDLHLDFTDDAGRSQLDLVIERTLALGMAGRVTVGHVTTLVALTPDEQAEALDRMAAAGIALVAVPVTDLYLGGHGEPGTRSLAPVERAIDAGVAVAIANNNVANPFAPYGNASLLQAAWLSGITRRVNSQNGRARLLDAITATPAAILDLGVHGPAVGAIAHLAVLDTTDPADIVAQSPPVVATVRAGALVHVRGATEIAKV